MNKTGSVFIAQSFEAWRHHDSLETVLSRAEASVRDHPTDAHARWLLFELLCLLGAWERALKQLQTYATFSPGMEGAAQVMRGLIRAEIQRQAVFSGRQMPVPVIDFPVWMEALAQAIGHNVAGNDEVADELRNRALSQAPEAGGASNLGSFSWISDSDTRLGPVCELVAAGSYRWVAFADLKNITLSAPKRLLDLVWAEAHLVLQEGGVTLKTYIPVRYPQTELATDALRLARETSWQEAGETGVFAQGQKTWMTDNGDWAFLDLRECHFDSLTPIAT